MCRPIPVSTRRGCVDSPPPLSSGPLVSPRIPFFVPFFPRHSLLRVSRLRDSISFLHIYPSSLPSVESLSPPRLSGLQEGYPVRGGVLLRFSSHIPATSVVDLSDPVAPGRRTLSGRRTVAPSVLNVGSDVWYGVHRGDTGPEVKAKTT